MIKLIPDWVLDVALMIMAVMFFAGATVLFGDKDLHVRREASAIEAIGFYYQDVKGGLPMDTETIYKKQNKSLHIGMAYLAMPYNDNKEYWIAVFSDLIKCDVTGISSLTLEERNRIILYFKSKGAKINKPYVPASVSEWQKGDANFNISSRKRPLKVPKAKWPLVSKINAILLDLGLEWSYADGVSKKMFDVETTEWCDTDQLYKVVQALTYHQRRKTG